MCTLSVIRTRDDVVRLAFNRDELRTRPRGLPPRLVTIGEREVAMPVDPQSGGTWIAANDAGLIVALLNVNETGAAMTSRPFSRGRIVPRTAESSGIDDACRAICALRVTEYSPFRLIVLDPQEYLDARIDGRDLELSRQSLDGTPLMFTSSGLGDEIVERPRRELFGQIVDTQSPAAAMQDAFHAHRWPARPEMSVMMSRAQASTVSVTTLELRRDDVVMHYRDSANAVVDPPSLRLPLRHGLLR
jgi:hypothetical protein